jgi:hypothetical protein
MEGLYLFVREWQTTAKELEHCSKLHCSATILFKLIVMPYTFIILKRYEINANSIAFVIRVTRYLHVDT